VKYQVELEPPAHRALRRLRKSDPTTAARIGAALDGLGDQPRPPGVKALSGNPKGRLRVRIGDYRIIYRIDDDRLLVLVLDLGHRRNIYG